MAFLAVTAKKSMLIPALLANPGTVGAKLRRQDNVTDCTGLYWS